MTKEQVQQKIEHWNRIKDRSKAESEIEFCNQKIEELEGLLAKLDEEEKVNEKKKKKPPMPPPVEDDFDDIDMNPDEHLVKQKKEKSLIDDFTDLF